MILPLSTGEATPVQFWAPQYKADILERIQQRAMKMMKGLEHLTYEEGLRDLGLFSMEKRMCRGFLSICVNSRKEGGKRTEPGSIQWCRDRPRGNGHKLKHWGLPVDIRKHLFTVTVTKHSNRIPREVVESPSLEMSGQLTLGSPGRAGRAGPDDLQRSLPTSTIL